ncbi:hypothetical protein WR25_22993 [Diploscapter pachys]|uniref:Uncharacterized protein n=1 Tax=Diploscapter pachys TaxID=2018661 RepID=A0A2A2M5Z4_9BILA|nr:hypothetical protein WR25_22993 [Diploscapter pachys]
MPQRAAEAVAQRPEPRDAEQVEDREIQQPHHQPRRTLMPAHHHALQDEVDDAERQDEQDEGEQIADEQLQPRARPFQPVVDELRPAP